VLLDVGSTPTISTTMNLVIATVTGFLNCPWGLFGSIINVGVTRN